MLDKIYSGDPEAAIPLAKDMQLANQESALGFILEGEARWAIIYCAAIEMKWGMVDAWKRTRATAVGANGENQDDAYEAVSEKAVQLALAGIARSNNATDHLYAGMAYALKARLFGLRGESRATAHAGVAARQEFIDALAIDPKMADATAGLGLYNYYVDSLSTIVKMLRFFMGIPGGNKQEGIKQLEEGAANGVLMKTNARYYLARNFRTFDQEYARAAGYMAPLVEQYPKNPCYQLMMANLEIEQGKNAEAKTRLESVMTLGIAEPHCAEQSRKLAKEMLATIHP
ncbi:MAG: hypothetical protein WA823_18970 [Candidatus Acidiferrales bacterium]